MGLWGKEGRKEKRSGWAGWRDGGLAKKRDGKMGMWNFRAIRRCGADTDDDDVVTAIVIILKID